MHPSFVGRLGLVLIIFSCGCTSLTEYVRNGFKVGPNYCRPCANVGEDWLDSDDQHVNGQFDSPTNVDFCCWWTSFEDPTLDRLIEIATQQNISLREACWRIERARALRGIAKGNFFPQRQEAFGNYRHIEQSEQNNRRVGGDNHFSDWDLGGTLSWELDFWGRYRRAILAADANLDASVENYREVKVLLRADVAATYVNIRTIEQRLVYARQNVKIQTESVARAQDRFDLGAANAELDLPQAKSNLAQTEAEIPNLEIELRRAKNRLSVLLGMPPQDLATLLEGASPIPTAPADLVVGVPADLLRRRPDIRRAERLLAAQSEQIGIALSDLYPQFTINGTISLDARQFQDLFDRRSFAGNVGSTFRWNILNYGRIINDVRAQDARFHELAETYRRTVLEANEEAENAIVGFLKTQRRVRRLKESVEQAETARERATAATDYNRIFNLEQLLVRQQDQLARSQGAIALNFIDIYKALGGGWQTNNCPSRVTRLPQPTDDLEESLPGNSAKLSELTVAPAELPLPHLQEPMVASPVVSAPGTPLQPNPSPAAETNDKNTPGLLVPKPAGTDSLVPVPAAPNGASLP